MSYATYKLIHLVGIFALMVALAGLAAHAASGHTKNENTSYKTLLALHGMGALVALVGGFGLLARITAEGAGMFPGWIWGKLILWIVLGGLVGLPYRNKAAAGALLLVLPLLGFLAAFLAIQKPF